MDKYKAMLFVVIGFLFHLFIIYALIYPNVVGLNEVENRGSVLMFRIIYGFLHIFIFGTNLTYRSPNLYKCFFKYEEGIELFTSEEGQNYYRPYKLFYNTDKEKYSEMWENKPHALIVNILFPLTWYGLSYFLIESEKIKKEYNYSTDYKSLLKQDGLYDFKENKTLNEKLKSIHFDD